MATVLSSSSEKTRVLRIWKSGLPFVPRKSLETLLLADSPKLFRSALEAELAAGSRPQILDALTVEQEASVTRLVRRDASAAQRSTYSRAAGEPRGGDQ